MTDDATAGDGLHINASHRPPEPDAHGHAALLLVESVLHALVETKVLTLAHAAAAVRTACEVKADYAAGIGESAERMQQSIDLLGRIERSLESDGRAGDGAF